jgi:hypothetical protein
MEFSTFIVLAIAVFIIIYRVKTWNDVTVTASEPEIVEEVVEYKVDATTQEAASQATKTVEIKSEKKKTDKAKPAAKKKESSKADTVKKSLKADAAKNKVLLDAVNNDITSQKAFEIKSQPKRGVTTYITLVDLYCVDDRAVGMIYEKHADTLTIIKSFDVKMTKGQFKVSTNFSKSVAVKTEDMKAFDAQATHYFVSEDKSVEVANVTLTLK